uniref:Uncharacterized protein n=1 Tax=Cannabis sativa TaxID=3483 RepID=A0A803QJR9_CANSA
MTQVDLETLVSACAGGGGGSMDRKIACETLADTAEKPPEQDSGEPEVPPDFPPESFWLSKDAEYDWLDRNVFYERKESQKGNSHSTNLNPNLNPGSNSNSQRFSMNLKSKAAIIGLPKPQKTHFVEAKNRKNCKAGNARLFPKRSASTGKSDGPMIEPSSPKVSCMGRVRSKRDRKRRWRKNRQRSLKSSSEPAVENVKPVERRKTGFFATFRAIFRTGCREKADDGSWRPIPISDSHSGDSVSTRNRDFSGVDIDAPSFESHPRRSVEIEAPGLGGMNRFASGRRSSSWVGDSSGIHVA